MISTSWGNALRMLYASEIQWEKNRKALRRKWKGDRVRLAAEMSHCDKQVDLDRTLLYAEIENWRQQEKEEDNGY